MSEPHNQHKLDYLELSVIYFFFQFEQFSIAEDYSLEVAPYVERNQALELVEQALASKRDFGAGDKFNLDQLPFDIGLNLNEKERQAKANVQLPYMAAQTEKGVFVPFVCSLHPSIHPSPSALSIHSCY